MSPKKSSYPYVSPPRASEISSVISNSVTAALPLSCLNIIDSSGWVIITCSVSFFYLSSFKSREFYSKNFWKILFPWSARIFWTPDIDFSKAGVVNILRQSCILWVLFMSTCFFLPLRREQIINDESIDILLNFLIFKFFFDLTASFVNEIAKQLAKKSSSAFFIAFLRGIWSSY